jgi:hypothetical protein
MESVLVIVAIVIVVAIVCLVDRYRFRSPYTREAISEDEFMAKLPAGTSRDVALRVRAIISEQSGIDAELIHPDSTFIDLFE